nr:MAG TPA: hypothetical protein [Caudoviricetes sp.]
MIHFLQQELYRMFIMYYCSLLILQKYITMILI